MADLGTINTVYYRLGVAGVLTPTTGATQVRDGGLSYTPRKVALWSDSPTKPYITAGASAHISGIVKENGIPVSRIVRLYHRITGTYIDQYITLSDGLFIFYGLDITDKYYCIAFDDLTLTPDLNAIIYDLLIPVPD